MLSILLVILLAISAVSAADNITDDNASMNEDVNYDVTTDNASIEANSIDTTDDLNEDEILSSSEDDNIVSSQDDEDNLGATYPYSYSYSVYISDTTITYSDGGSISMTIYPASSSYTYKYYYYLKIYDSNGNQVKSSTFYNSGSSTSSTTRTYSLNAYDLTQGTYTMKIQNYYDSRIMDTATLKVISVPHSAYSVSVSGKTINYGSSDSIYMSISPASSSYNYKYDYYLKVYDSNNVEKISQRYYGTSSAYSKTYYLDPTELNIGVYTIKILNNGDNYVMDTATLTVKSVPYNAYSVSVEDTSIIYGSSGSIYMGISPASSSYYYKYDYYLKVYDSDNVEKISQRYYSTSSTYSETYYLSSTKLSQGVYTIKLINSDDNYLMDSAKLYIIDKDFSISSDYQHFVDEDVIIDYTISNKATGYLSVYLNDSFVKTVAIGDAINLGKLNGGDYTVKVTYAGNQYLPSFEDSIDIYVSKLPLDYYEDCNLIAGNRGTIKFIFDEPTTGSISVYFPDFTAQKTFSSNIVNGEASITIPGVRAGNHEYELTYYGNSLYEPISYGDIYVDYKNAPITVYIPEVTWGQEMKIEPSLPKGATGYLELYIDNVLVNNMSVGDNYRFTAVNGGEHTLKVIYSGDDYYISNQTTQKFTIKRFDTAMNINSTIMANPTSLLQITLNNDATGDIAVTIDDVKKGTYHVENGTCRFNVYDLYKGSHNVIIEYYGDAKYNPFKIAKELVCVAKNPNISLKLNNIYINNDIVIRPIVNSTASGSLDVYVDDYYEKSISVGNSYRLTKPSVGKHEVLIKYAGNNYYDSQNITATFRVFTRDPIVANDMKIVYGTDVKFKATFYDEYGALLNNTFVQFSVNGTDYPVLTDEYGVATLNVDLPVGNYKVTSISLLDESQVNNLLVFHSVFAENTVLEYGSPKQFNAIFLDETAKALSNTGVIFVVDGITQPMAMTDVNGIAYLDTTLPLGKHTVTSINTITNQQMTNDVYMVLSIDGVMKLNDINNINYGQKAALTINIGNSYLNGNVDIRLTNEKGYNQVFRQKAAKTITREFSNLPAGKYTAYVTYTGNDDELVLTLNKTFTVYKIDPVMEYEIHDAGYGDTVEIRVNVLNLNSTVSFRVDGSSYSSISLVNGTLVKYISGLSKGVHILDIIFNGDDNYNPLLKTDKINIYTRLNVEYDSIFIISDEYIDEQYITITNLPSTDDGSRLVLFIDGVQVKIDDSYFDDDEDYTIEFHPKLSEGKHNFEIKNYDEDGNIIGYKNAYFEAINWKHYGGSNFELVSDKTVTYIPNKDINWYVKTVGLKNGAQLYLSPFTHNGITYTLISGLGYAGAHSPVFKQFNPDEYVIYDKSYYKLENGIITNVIQSGHYEVIDGIYYEYIGRFSDYETVYSVINGKCYAFDGFYHDAVYGVDYRIINGYYYTLDGERIDEYYYDDMGIINGTIYNIGGNVYHARTASTLGYDLLDVNGNLYLLVHGDFDEASQKYLNDYAVIDGKLYHVMDGIVGSQIQLKQSVASTLSISLNSGFATVKLSSGVTGTVTLNIAGKNYVGYLNNGEVTIKYPELASGVHMYIITYSGDNSHESFRKTGSFTVKAVPKANKITLKLKKVKVKKSAKKLVITATLKINNKPVSAKTIKFKFNKKSYSAKTNKKGVAKITINKKILKKLKKGKKVTYTAAYGKTVSKKKVKVK